MVCCFWFFVVGGWLCSCFWVIPVSFIVRRRRRISCRSGFAVDGLSKYLNPTTHMNDKRYLYQRYVTSTYPDIRTVTSLVVGRHRSVQTLAMVQSGEPQATNSLLCRTSRIIFTYISLNIITSNTMLSYSAVTFVAVVLATATSLSDAYSIPTRSTLRSLGQHTITSSTSTTKSNEKSTLTMEGMFH